MSIAASSSEVGIILTPAEKKVVLSKIGRYCSIEGKKIEEIIDGIKTTGKKCACDDSMFCILIFNGTIDICCTFIHICLNPRCRHLEIYDSNFLREGENPECLLCAQ